MDKYDKVMKKANEFYDKPKVEETYCLTDNLVRFILPRLKLFVKESSKIIDWKNEKEIRHIDIIETLNLIINDFEEYLELQKELEIETNYNSVLSLDYRSQLVLQNGFAKLSIVCAWLDW